MTELLVDRTAGLATQGRPNIVYADCHAAIQEAWNRGLPRDIPVRTVAPAILADKNIETHPANERLTGPCIAALEDALLAAADEIWNGLRTGDANDTDKAVVGGRTLFGDFQGYVFAAATLRDEDFTGPVAVVTSSHDDTNQQFRFRYRVADILQGKKNVSCYSIPASSLPEVCEPTPPTPPFVTRLQQASMSAMFYRLGRICWDHMPGWLSRGTILVLRENELTKEAGARLLARGYSLRAASLPPFPDNFRLSEADAGIRTLTRKAIRRHFTDLVPHCSLPVLESQAETAVCRSIHMFQNALPRWRALLSRQDHVHVRAAITNLLVTPEAAAFHAALRERNIPLIAMQHGVTPEISKRTERYGLGHENAACDLALTFNRKAAALFNRNPYGRGRALTVGMPEDYRHQPRLAHRADTSAIWYISTRLYQSNLGRLHRGLSDVTIFEYESALISEVFEKLPHPVIYKPYPAIRYLDPDPVAELIDAIPNVNMYSERLDLRYVASRARILITSGATSTVSWCLMSGKPTIYLHSDEFMPLNDEALLLFRDGLFVFDQQAPDFHEQLHAFLCRPLGEIERDWQTRHDARLSLIEAYIAAPISDAGAAAADAVIAAISPAGAVAATESS